MLSLNGEPQQLRQAETKMNNKFLISTLSGSFRCMTSITAAIRAWVHLTLVLIAAYLSLLKILVKFRWTIVLSSEGQAVRGKTLG